MDYSSSDLRVCYEPLETYWKVQTTFTQYIMMGIYDLVIILSPRNQVTKSIRSLRWFRGFWLSLILANYKFNSSINWNFWMTTEIFLSLPVLADLSTFELADTADNKIGDNFIFRLLWDPSLTVWSLLSYWHQRWRGWWCRRLIDPFHVLSPNTVFI